MTTDSAQALIRAILHAAIHRRNCLQVPIGDLPDELLTAALEKLEEEGRPTSEVRGLLAKYGVKVRPLPPAEYTRRNNNQIPRDKELLIQELLKRNWKKTRIARALGVNRRTIIRVSREMRDV